MPGCSLNALKRHENRIGKHVEQVAQQSCKKALSDEIAVVKEKNDAEFAEITASYDAGWQCRGSSKNYK